MAILPSQLVAQLEQILESEVEEEPILDENVELPPSLGPWILIVTTGGYGKRVPVAQFRLQNRAGKGIVATKFRKKGDRLAALHIVHEGEELMVVTNRGIIIRQAVDAISSQSRPATGVRVQRLDDDDAIAVVAIVPPSTEEEEALAAENLESSAEPVDVEAVEVEVTVEVVAEIKAIDEE